MYFRPYSVTIDAPKPGVPPIVSMKIQKIKLNEEGKIDSISGHEDAVYKNAEPLMANTFEFTDPVTGMTGQISIAGITQAISQAAIGWTAEELNCEIDKETGWLTKPAD